MLENQNNGILKNWNIDLFNISIFPYSNIQKNYILTFQYSNFSTFQFSKFKYFNMRIFQYKGRGCEQKSVTFVHLIVKRGNLSSLIGQILTSEMYYFQTNFYISKD